MQRDEGDVEGDGIMSVKPWVQRETDGNSTQGPSPADT